jgi:hypothetical protein
MGLLGPYVGDVVGFTRAIEGSASRQDRLVTSDLEGFEYSEDVVFEPQASDEDLIRRVADDFDRMHAPDGKSQSKL